MLVTMEQVVVIFDYAISRKTCCSTLLKNPVLMQRYSSYVNKSENNETPVSVLHTLEFPPYHV